MKNEKPNIVMGYTTRRHLLLDLDKTTLTKVMLLARLIQQFYIKVGDALIIISSVGTYKQRIRYTKYGRPLVVRSLDNYHVVFDATIGYNSCCRIISTLAVLGILNRDYLKIRTFRGDMTLRISPMVCLSGIKPMPYPMWLLQSKHLYKRGGNIDKYLSALRNAYAMWTKQRFCFEPLSLFQRNPLLKRLWLPRSKRNNDRLDYRL